jgi:hypothetical protein
MVSYGTARVTYEPYFEGLRNTKLTSFESRGKNLAQKQYGITSSGTSVSTTKIIEDKTGKVCSSLIPVIGGKKYTLSKTYLDQKSEFRWFFYDREPILNETQAIGGTYQPGSNKYTITIPDNASYLYVRWTTNEETSPCGDVQIELGAGVTEYKPYSAEPIDSYPIPEAVQSIEGYGESNPDNPEEHNYTDLINKKQVNVGKITNDTWVKFDTPIETDICDLLSDDNFLKVEGGGVIRAVNEYKYGVPSTIKYTVKVGS